MKRVEECLPAWRRLGSREGSHLSAKRSRGWLSGIPPLRLHQNSVIVASSVGIFASVRAEGRREEDVPDLFPARVAGRNSLGFIDGYRLDSSAAAAWPSDCGVARGFSPPIPRISSP